VSTDKKLAALVLSMALAAPAEGLRQWAYKDPTGLPTICLGSTKGVQMGDFRTNEECKALLTLEMWDTVNQVDACVPGLPTNVLAAFSDAAYNLGSKIACNTKVSTAARKLKAGDFVGACKELPKWDKANVLGVMVPLPGLTTRRGLEEKVCLNGL